MVPNPLNSRNLTITLQSQFPVDTMPPPPSPADQVYRGLKGPCQILLPHSGH